MRSALLSSVSFVFLALAPLTAHAGFEFVPPPAAAPVVQAPAAQAPAVPVVENAPVATENLEPTPYVDQKATLPAAPEVAQPSDEPMVLGRKAVPLTPVVKSSDALVFDDAPAMPAPIAPRATAPVANTQDVLWDDKTDTYVSDLPPALPSADVPEMIAPKIAAADIEDGLPVQGFGRQVPLAMALQQIVPPNYRYSFDTGVDPGQRISWTGGKSWKAVITDIARNNGLNVDIVTNVVAFHRRTPMDIVASSSSIDVSSDTVQGMPLMPVANAQDDLVVLPPIDTTATPKNITEKRKYNEAKEAEASKTRKAKFDSMLGTDTPAQAFVKNKRILTADDEPAIETNAGDATAPAEKLPAGAYGAEPIASMSDADLQPAKAVTTEKKIDVAPAPVLFDEVKTAKVEEAAPMNIVPTAPSNVQNDTVIESDLPAKESLAKAKAEAKFDSQFDEKSDEKTEIAAALPPQADWMKPLPTDDGITAAPIMSSTAAESVPADLKTVKEWEGFKNQTLRETLTSWSQAAGVSVVWSSEYDYPLQTDVRVSADYGDAVRTLLAGFSKAQPRPIGRLFKNDKVGAQPVLVVETQRLTN